MLYSNNNSNNKVLQSILQLHLAVVGQTKLLVGVVGLEVPPNLVAGKVKRFK